VAEPAAAAAPEAFEEARRQRCLAALERRVRGLSPGSVHHANHVRPRRDGLKVGGHQASCASVTGILTALYFDALRPGDRVAVKPHASPVFHAIQYLLGRQDLASLQAFRRRGGAQAYPCRTADGGGVDFSTGSVGLGVAMTLFAALARDLVAGRGGGEAPPGGRAVAIAGDAELDEGNVFEALLEGWKHDLRGCWWIVDYNRQSLDAVLEDRLAAHQTRLFSEMGWRVRTLKYGSALEEAFRGPGGPALRGWIDRCPNALYSALVAKGGAGWREHLHRDLGHDAGVRELLRARDDDALAALMTNLAGHDLPTLLRAFREADDDAPTCFWIYTVKGYGLPFAGHKDNHAGLTTPGQIAALRAEHGLAEGREWEPFAGLDVPEEELRAFLAQVPWARGGGRRHRAAAVPVPRELPVRRAGSMSTQEGFGRLLAALAREGGELADAVVTSSPDVTVSTGLGGWVNRRGLFHPRERADVFREEQVASPQRWTMSPRGQHVELGIAENNLFLLMAALGLSHELFGRRLLPVGVLYDPFVSRGLDALRYACYQDARFLLVGTPSGVSLAPEGGADQSVITPLVGMAQPRLLAFEPAYVDELAELVRFAFEHLQAPDGSAVYLRLSTRSLEQPDRELDEGLRREVVRGGYWWAPPGPGARLAIACSGAVTDQAREAHRALCEDLPETGLLIVTSPDRLHREWRAAQRDRAAGRDARAHVESLLAPLAPGAPLVTVHDGHPAALSWLGSVRGQRAVSLGVEDFGESGDVAELYETHRIDAEAVVDAAARALLDARA